jgi:hypothetical protein
MAFKKRSSGSSVKFCKITSQFSVLLQSRIMGSGSFFLWIIFGGLFFTLPLFLSGAQTTLDRTD